MPPPEPPGSLTRRAKIALPLAALNFFGIGHDLAFRADLTTHNPQSVHLGIRRVRG